MEPAILPALIGLALLDSTSIGTLFIPVWLLLSPGRVSSGQILIYLITIALFYFVVGWLLMLGAGSLLSGVNGLLDTRPAIWAQLLLGAGLFLISFRFNSKRSRARGGHGRAGRWRERTATQSASHHWLMGLALMAALAEVATMLPYLAAIAIIGTADINMTSSVALLAGYCLVMVLPAIALLVGRNLSEARIRPILERMDRWITENAETAIGWILGIVGVLLALDAAGKLWN